MLRRARLSELLRSQAAATCERRLSAIRRSRGTSSSSFSTQQPVRTVPTVHNPSHLAKGKERQDEIASAEEERAQQEEQKIKAAAKLFEAQGLNPRLSLQLVRAYPHIRSPTAAQKALLSVIAKDNDVILRSMTASGKSFGMLLGLLNKPRLVVHDKSQSTSSKRITSIVVVPSRELALQYEGWARRLFPANMQSSLPSVIAARFRSKDISVEEHLKQLAKNPPHILVVTATLLHDMLGRPEGATILGINTLRTLALDEVDALLDLPGRFPSQKLIWKHMKHPPEGLQALNMIMKQRASHSSGDGLPSAGIEKRIGGINDELRRKVHQGNDRLQERHSQGSAKFVLNPAGKLGRGEKPLQLIALSATANSVLRNFLGAKTGWLRTGLQNLLRRETGKWLDLTGLSAGLKKSKEQEGLEETTQFGWALQLPKELKHSCVVVDEPSGDSDSVFWRALHPSLARSGKGGTEGEEGEEEEEEEEMLAQAAKGVGDVSGPRIVSSTTPGPSVVDENLLTCLAFLFATQPVQNALALIPSNWSLAKTKAYLSELDIPIGSLEASADSSTAAGNSRERQEGVLYLTQASAVRGLDIPGGLSHVFCVGMDAIRDATTYTHLAGRASRIGLDEEGSHERPPGHVITLIRGLSMDQVRQNREIGKMVMMASNELKMSLIYRRLNLKLFRPTTLTSDDVQDDEQAEVTILPKNSEQGGSSTVSASNQVL